MTKFEWAYYAGLFDGEGSVTVAQVTRRTDTKSCKAGQTLTNMSVRISNNNPVPLLELEKKFGGRVRPHSSKRTNSWVWIACGHEAVEFSKRILPFTRIKTGQLEIYIAFAALKRRRARGRTKLTKDELSERRKLISKLDQVRKSEGGKIGARLMSSEAL